MKKRRNLAVLLILVILLLSLLGVAVGKYRSTFEAGSGSVEFTAKLATQLILQEHKAERQSNGKYILRTDEDPVTANTYHLIPGVDIPKDPHVIVKGKTEVPAYLFIEVTSTLDAPVAYTVNAANWTLVQTSDTTKVYCYKDILTETFTDNPVYILTDFISDGQTCNIEVGQNLRTSPDYDEAADIVTIRALLIEKLNGLDAVETYAKR